MKKFAFIGAGSMVFTRNLVRDLLTFPAFADAEIALLDIDDEKLEIAKQGVEKIIKNGGYPAHVLATKDRIEAIKDADGVLCTIAVGDFDTVNKDVDIPYKYGVDFCVGDTRGISGIFRALRTWPVLLEICRDMEKYCPNAVFLNYTNPMAILCRAMQSETKLNVTGLCHSVQGTSEMLARWIGADMNDVTYTCAGVNHQAFYIDYKVNGVDAYPAIKEAIKKPEIYNEEIVRNELLKHLGYYVTESSGHCSEYVPWFRKRQDLIDKFCAPGTGWNPGFHKMGRKDGEEIHPNWQQEFLAFADDPKNLERGHEYAAYIFNAIFGDETPFEFNGNIRNFGIIDNLPYGCCIESPVWATKKGYEPVRVGKLPPELAILISSTAQQEELAVEGMINGDASKIYQACYFDPVSAAKLSLEEIKAMVRELFEANKDYLGYFKSFDAE